MSAASRAVPALALALVACEARRGDLFLPLGDAGPACPQPRVPGRLAEWRADGDLTNLEPCSSWRAQIIGAVPYGPGRDGQAWHFRSQQASTNGDPDYVLVTGAAGALTPQVTVDAWVRQVSFNAYNGSNRVIVASSWKNFTFEPGEWMLYLHENSEVYFYYRVSRDPAANVGWATCGMRAGVVPTGTWVRFTGSYDGAHLTCYRDGVRVGEVALPAGSTEPIGDPIIGRNYPGDVDAVRVFDVALGEADVARPWP